MIAAIGIIASTVSASSPPAPPDRSGLFIEAIGNNASGTVAVWPDTSGDGNDLTQSTVGQRPVVSGTTLNGNDGVGFDGVNDFLDFGIGNHVDSGGSVTVVFRSAGTNGHLVNFKGSTAGLIIVLSAGAGFSPYFGFRASNAVKANFVPTTGVDYIYTLGYTGGNRNSVSSFWLLVNGEQVALSNGGLIGGTANVNTLAADGSSGGSFGGIAWDFRGWSESFTADRANETNAYLGYFYGIDVIETPVNLCICDGNSLTEGAGSTTGHDYPSVLAASLGAKWRVINYGVGGQSTQDMIADAASQVDVARPPTRTRKIVVAWEIVNDINNTGTPTVDAIAHFKTYCAGRIAAGFTVIALTCLSQDAAPTFTDSVRAIVNAAIRDGAEIGVSWDAVADVAANPNIGPNGAWANLTYFQSDKIHLTDAGYAIVAGTVKAAVDAL